MNRIERMLQELCPEGVEYKKLGEVSNITIGEFVHKNKQNLNGKYPVYNGGTSNTGFYDEFNNTKNKIIISARGANAGFVNRVFVNYWAGNSCYSIKINDPKELDWNYIYYYLKSNQTRLIGEQQTGSIPAVSKKQIYNIEIPIPPLPIQEEIVRILDHFTELTASLQAELQARQEQYKYYKDQLLKLNVAEYRTLGSLSKFRRGSFPQPYGNKDWYDGDGAMPFVQVADIADDKKLVANTKRKISSLAQPMSVFAPKGSIIISLQGSIGKIAITQYDAYIDRTLAIFQNITNDVLPKYFVYQLERIFEIKEKTARGSTIKTITKEEFTNFQIPIPSISEQKRIVFILDKFETLVNDLSKGLPAEIAAVQEQYEYYRNKLLTFNRIQSN